MKGKAHASGLLVIARSITNSSNPQLDLKCWSSDHLTSLQSAVAFKWLSKFTSRKLLASNKTQPRHVCDFFLSLYIVIILVSKAINLFANQSEEQCSSIVISAVSSRSAAAALVAAAATRPLATHCVVLSQRLMQPRRRGGRSVWLCFIAFRFASDHQGAAQRICLLMNIDQKSR